MLGNLTGWHFVIIALIVVLLFGATRLPALARSIGQSTKIFREEMKTDAPTTPEAGTTTAETPADPAAPTGPGTSAKP